MLECMRILRSFPIAFLILLVACGGGSLPGNGVDTNKTTIIILPSKATVSSRGTVQFTATVGGDHDRAIYWSATVGTVSSRGYYNAPTVTIVTTAVITARTTAGSTTTTVTIQPPMPSGPLPISVSISPEAVTLKSGARQLFIATVSGTKSHDITWSTTNGTVTSEGLFTTPGVGVVTRMAVKATSQADPTKTASARVTALAQLGLHMVDLSWNASTSTDILGYNIYRGQVASGPYLKINTGGLVASTLYSDTNVGSGITYYYVATVVDSRGQESAHSNQAQAAIPQ
jgi:hypothetical protein